MVDHVGCVGKNHFEPLVAGGMLVECIKQLQQCKPITVQQAQAAMQEISSGEAKPTQVSAFLALLESKGIPMDPEILAVFAKVLRAKALPCVVKGNQNYMDIVGTGGDGFDTFNVSTTAAFVVAACGVPILKHGNRASSSKCGSADLLEKIGAKIDLDGPASARVLQDAGFCFLFAPKFHPALKHIAPVRKEMAVRTVFNVMGPLLNPGFPKMQMSGVSKFELGEVYAKAFQSLGVVRGLVVHGEEGLDEISIAGKTHMWFVEGDSITKGEVTPEDFGVKRCSLSVVSGGSTEENVETFWKILNGEQGHVTDFVLINAAAALRTAGRVSNWKEGVALAKKAIEDGAARQVAEQYIEKSNSAKNHQSEKSILHEIFAERRKFVDNLKAQKSFEALLLDSLKSPSAFRPLDVLKRIKRGPFRLALMSEIKRASPSKGDINVNVDVAKTALAYAQGGACVISVLTEPKWFKGSLDDLKLIRKTIDCMGDARPAVLLKDFVVDEYQLAEARHSGADLALLIVKMLEKDVLKRLFEYGRRIGLELLVEVNDEDEMKIALDIGAELIGINNRNLHNFHVDMDTTTRLVSMIPPAQRGKVAVAALSGIGTRADVEKFESDGVQGVLVGESLMLAKDPTAHIKSLMGPIVLRQPFVKVILLHL
jgi:anthranilate phosphoribosyltransferase